MLPKTLHRKILAGKIGAPHGIKGWLKVFSYTDPHQNLLQYQPWWLESQGKWQSLQISQGQVHGKHLLVVFDHLKDRDQAAKLTHANVYIERSQLPPLSEGEYYWADLEGLTVKNLVGFVFGKVVQLMATGTNDVMFVKGTKEICLPYLPGKVIKKIDLAQKEILVDWPA